MTILFKYASRGRSKWFKETLCRWQSMLSGKHDCRFVISLDNDDQTMNNDQVKFWLNHRKIEYHFGDHKTKIEAINADMQGQDFDILVVVSDDMWPEVFGFDDIIATDMQEKFPDLDGALHYNDGLYGKDKAITLSIMGKKLYDILGYIYYPEYKSMWCDNEFTDVVRMMSKYAYVPRVIVKHEWKKYGVDRLYARNNNQEWWEHDKELYLKRKEEMSKCLVA